MRFGLFLPPFADFAEPARVVDLARQAEEAGWDGLFLWDHVVAAPGMAVADAWVTLAAVATATSRLRLGIMVTPLARRRPWVLARQAISLDRLSRGRLTIGIGLGDDGWREFSAFGEQTTAAVRGRLLDEALDVLTALLSGRELHHHGETFNVETTAFLPRPLQDPLPIWVACRWPHRRPLARAARVQGCFPMFAGPPPIALPDPVEVAAIRRLLVELGADASSDLIIRASMSIIEPARLEGLLAELENAGVTWMLEAFGPGEPAAPAVQEVVRQGPPSPRNRGFFKHRMGRSGWPHSRDDS
jgi:alkanesulfonate monooxygenase SsuD/methylene tetrahydromethanopterin reductase-like flavin-dependent oxidoreductase (luciferase family)